jgi:RHS repeat-associated protein
MAWLPALSVLTSGNRRGRGRVAGRIRRRVPRWVATALSPVLAAGAGLGIAPVAVLAAGTAAIGVASIARATPAKAASGSVLILSTSVNGGSSSAEATAAAGLGYTVTVATPATWDAMTTAQFKAYSALIIGDPSTGSTCASTVPSDALSTAGTWGPAVTGNVSVLGTAPVLAGTAGSALIADGIGYAVTPPAGLSGTTGLYVSLNCEYRSAAANTAVPLLASVDGGGFTVTGQSASCPDSGTVNTWQADAAAAFNGLTSGALASWASPACSVQETVTAWPAGFTPVAYAATSGSFGSPADFTASDGASGEPYVLAGAPVSSGTAALAPSAGGEVPAGTTIGGSNAADRGLALASAGDPVNTENGDFSESATDLSIPTFGPALSFSRTYDALLAQQQTQAGTPGPLGFGWTDNWASSVSTAKPVPGDIYTLDGLGTNDGDGGSALSAPLDSEDGVTDQAGNFYIADSEGNRVQEVAGATGTQWGIPMTAGDVYTVVGSALGEAGVSANGAAATSALIDDPESVAFDPSGNMYVADAGNNRVLEIPVSTGTQRGISMTANDIYTIAGSSTGASGDSGDSGAATSALLNTPTGIAFNPGTSDLYISDYFNSRVQEVPAATGSQWGISMTANDMYTVAGSKTGVTGDSANGVLATSALLDNPEGIGLAGGDLYIADTVNNRVIEVPSATATQWGISMTKNDIYTVAGSSTGTSGTSGDKGKATSALLDYPESVTVSSAQQLYVADSGNSRIQEVARTTHTEFGQSMTANDIYTVAGSSAGTAGFSGDGGAATSALLDTPGQVALDTSSDLYIADSDNNRIREVNASTAKIATTAGTGGMLGTVGDGGPATTAALSNPAGIATDAKGNVYIADTNNQRVQEIAATSHTQFGIAMTAGDVYTIAGSPVGVTGDTGDGGPATSALLDSPIAVAVDAAGDVYVADYGNNRIQEVAAASGTQRGIAMTAGDMYTVAGSATGNSGFSGDGGVATSALLSFPWGLAVDGGGDIYIADENNNRVEEVAGATGSQWGQSMTSGDIYTVAGSATSAFGDSGNGGLATSALLTAPSGVVVDGAGNLYLTDDGNNRIQEVAVATGMQRGQSMTKNDIYTVAGNASGNFGDSGNGGPATSALLWNPMGIAIDSSGNLYITDNNNNRIQEVAFANGTQWGTSMTANDVYTITGSASGASGTTGDGGPAKSALLQSPIGVAADPAGDIFLTDNGNNRIREVTATAVTALPEAPAPGGITVNQADGSQVTFYPQVSGACTAPYTVAGGYCALPQYQGASLTFSSVSQAYTYTPQPGMSFTYGWNGPLTAEADAAGDILSITYGTPAPGTGNCPATATSCDTITSASGRTLTSGLNSAGLVTSVTDPMGRTWSYGYTGSDLTKVTDPMGNVTTYSYGQGSTGNADLANDLLTITSPNAQPGGPDAGDATVNVYDSSGRVTTQTDPSGFKSTFNYCVNAADGNCLNASTGTGYVTVTDPDGNTTIDSYLQGALAAESVLTGTTLSSEQDFVPDLTAGGTSGGTMADTTTADADGAVTTSSYDASGNLISSTSPDGVGSQTGTTTSQFTSLDQDSCDGTVLAATACSSSQTGPVPVAPGGVITPPSAAPPSGVSYTLYDTDGNELYTTSGVYEPGSTTASYSQTTYQLFKGNSVTVGGNHVTCTASPPSLSLPCATISADGVVTQLAYSAAGDLTSASTPDGNGSELATTTYSYDADGERLTAVSPDGNVSGGNIGNYTTVTAYNADGEQKSVTQAGGSGATVTPRVTNYGYDGDGNQTTVQDARGFTTTTAYNADDQAMLVTDPLGNSQLTCYDGDGNIAQTVPYAGVAANSLTAASCPTAYPAGYSDRLASDATADTLNAHGQVTQQTTPAPAGQSGFETTAYTYDGNGNLITSTAPPATGSVNQVTVDSYNSAGELATQTNGYGTTQASTTSYCYDPDGRRTSVVMPDGNTTAVAGCETASPWVVSASSHPTQAAFQTTYSFDSAAELVSTTGPATAAAPSGATTTASYDPAGNMLTHTDPDGVITTVTYTPLNLSATVSYSGSSAHSVSYAYDANGNRTGMTDATGSPSYIWDPFGELMSSTSGAGNTVSYTYNADGSTTGITYPLPASATWAATDTVSYGYNNADLRTSATDFNGNQITITPNADGQPATLALGSTGDTISYAYDPTDSPSAITLKNSSTTLQSFAYSDAPAGNISSETDTPMSSTSPADYTYDAQSRVTSMTPGTGSPLNYGFDASANLTTLPTGAAGTYDDGSELTGAALGGVTSTYAYNADGERLTSKQGGTTITSGTWNGAGNLSSYDSPAADMTAATYDGNGIRASATSGTSQTFTWNVSGVAPQLLMDSVNAYIYAYSGTPAEQVNISTGVITYLISDSLGSVRGTVSGSGTLTGTTNYDAWGNPETTGGLTATTPFGYAGGYTDPTGLIYLINRYYDPATGQFTSVDPDVGQTLQPYGYAAGDPVTGTDPLGLYTVFLIRWKLDSQTVVASGHDSWISCGGYYDYRTSGDDPGCSLTKTTSNTWTGTLEVSIPILDGFLNLGGSLAIGHQFSVTFGEHWPNAKKDKYIGYPAYAETYVEIKVEQYQWGCKETNSQTKCQNQKGFVSPWEPSWIYNGTAIIRYVYVWEHNFEMTFLHCAHKPAVGQVCPFP